MNRARIARWLGGIAGAAGAGTVMLVCCTTTAAVAGGGLAAAGGVLRSPWLIAAGLLVIALALAALILQRTGHRAGADPCCPPTAPDARPAATKRIRTRQGVHHRQPQSAAAKGRSGNHQG